MIQFRILLVGFLLSINVGNAQTYHLDESLSEISGLEFLNDTTLVAHNDGGNEPILYLLNLKGEVLKEVKIKDAKNDDWEELAVSEEDLFIGDLGNNLNDRKNLVIYKVKITDLLEKEEVEAKEITIEYEEQKAFPPERAEMHFDAEAMTVVNDTIYIFTKNRTRPDDGMAWVYKVPTKKGEYKVSKFAEIYIGTGGFWKDALTAADYFEGTFYLMTYNRVLLKTLENGKFIGDEELKFKTFSQKEALVVKSKSEIFVSDEKQIMLGGPCLYRIQISDLKK